MSNILETLPGRERATNYDWNLWLDGRVHELITGEDFTVTLGSMRAMAFTRAKRIGVPVHTRATENGLAVQAIRVPTRNEW
jgi:hypothetical protein|tara:strand:+ start:118 stop:360 length:243 start_codon:yes stop_codon:yes gene_type:complete